MLFNSYVFVGLFLPMTVAIFYAVRAVSTEQAKSTLLLASLIFYGYWNVNYLPLLAGSIILNYLLAGAICRTRRISLLILTISGNLGLLFYFKYFDFFFAQTAWTTGLDALIGTTILPLGISFFTFQQIAYQVNGWTARRTSPGPFVDYAVYVSFFPQLVAGPIVRDTEFMPQLRAERQVFQQNLFVAGVMLFSLGLFKKVVIADTFATIATPLFDRPAGAPPLSFDQAWMAALAYTFQLYFDFSAYSDMAIGIGAMFGIVLPVNFLAPYRSVSIIDFWRRWHITLGRFFRDYLYIPLGGSRRGTARHAMNLGGTMVLCGLWHGAGWTFIAWGAAHGLALVANHLANRAGWLTAVDGPVRAVLAWGVTFAFVVLTWVLFRSTTINGAVEIWAGMAGLNGFSPTAEVGLGLPPTMAWAMIAGALAWVLVLPNPYQWLFGTTADDPRIEPANLRLGGRTAIAWGLLAAVALLSLSRTTEFLYYNF